MTKPPVADNFPDEPRPNLPPDTRALSILREDLLAAQNAADEAHVALEQCRRDYAALEPLRAMLLETLTHFRRVSGGLAGLPQRIQEWAKSQESVEGERLAEIKRQARNKLTEEERTLLGVD